MSRYIIFTAVLALLLAFPALALCETEIELSHVGGALWTKARHVTVNGSYAYCPLPYGIQIFDISDPSVAELAAEFYLPGSFDVLVRDNYAYVARGHNEAKDTSMLGLAILDISNPVQPILVGQYSTGYKVRGIDLSGDYAFLACGLHGGLFIVDISDPSSPSLVWREVTPGHAEHVAVSGNYVYVCDIFGVPIYDISDISNPTRVGEYTGLEQSLRIAVAGDYAYLADMTTGLEIIDVSDPTDPRHTANYSAMGTANGYDIMVEGTTAYLTVHTTDNLPWYSFLDVLDVTDPTTPVLLGRHELLNTSKPGLTVAGDLVFLADSDHLRTISVADPAAPTQIGDYKLSGMSWKVKQSGDYAYVASRGALVILDISAPDPVIVGSYPALSGWDVALQDNLAVVADYLAGVIILDITDPTTPVELASLDTPGKAISVTIAGDLLYVADDGSLLIYDISSPSSPVQLADVPTPGSASYVELSGDYAYVSDPDVGLQIVDVSDPANAEIIGTVSDLPIPVKRMRIVDDYCYVIAGGDFYVLDLSDPTSPVVATMLYIHKTPEDIVVYDNHAFLAVSFSGVAIVDISNPDEPVQVGHHSTPGYCYGVSADVDRICVTDWYGFEVLSYQIPVCCGDASGDGSINVGDAVRLIDYIFKSGANPQPVCIGDTNGDGQVNIGDAVSIVEYIFKGGAPPADDCCD